MYETSGLLVFLIQSFPVRLKMPLYQIYCYPYFHLLSLSESYSFHLLLSPVPSKSTPKSRCGTVNTIASPVAEELKVRARLLTSVMENVALIFKMATDNFMARYHQAGKWKLGWIEDLCDSRNANGRHGGRGIIGLDRRVFCGEAEKARTWRFGIGFCLEGISSLF